MKKETYIFLKTFFPSEYLFGFKANLKIIFKFLIYQVYNIHNTNKNKQIKKTNLNSLIKEYYFTAVDHNTLKNHFNRVALPSVLSVVAKDPGIVQDEVPFRVPPYRLD